MAQYGPLLAALIALAGALITLFVSGRRSDRESKVRREDEYRTSMRAAIVNVLLGARTFYQEGRELADPGRFVHLGYEGATELRRRANEAISSLSSALVEARLLALDKSVQDDLDAVLRAFDAAALVVHEAVNSFWEGRPPRPFWHERERRWRELAASCAKLQEDATSTLAPTVRAYLHKRF